MENQEIMNKIVEHARAIAELVSQQTAQKPEAAPVAKEYEDCETVTIKGVAEIVSEKMECKEENQKTVMNFLLSRMKAKGFLRYRFVNGSRLYQANPSFTAQWMIVPAECKEHPEYEFVSSDLRFRTKNIPNMLFDLWIGTKAGFMKEYTGYKDYIAKMKAQDGQ